MRNKSDLRGTIFRHLDGIVTAPTAYALHKKGVLDYLLKNDHAHLQHLVTEFDANSGYLNVALRVLASQGWLKQHINNKKDEVSYSVTEGGRIALPMAGLYEGAVALIGNSDKFHVLKYNEEAFRIWKKVLDDYLSNCGLTLSSIGEERTVQDQILAHIEGVLVGPVIVQMGMGGMFHKYFMETSFGPEEFHESPESFRTILDFFTHLGWFSRKGANYQYIQEGLFFARRGAAYGVTASYIPTFRHVEELIFGDPTLLWNAAPNAPEMHVDREMNVWGSGGAHATYFNVIDEVIIDLFNRPIEKQPKGILDMGCGNGAFLEHIFELVERQTIRGKMLEQYPLFLVGADYNQAALKVTRANLIKADIWAKVIWGDIGRPDLLAKDLKEHYEIDLRDLLNVRSFLDHNRIWQDPTSPSKNRESNSTGAFAFRGKRVSNNQVEENLLEHLQKWKPYVEKFGLLLIELHTVPPALTAANIGKTPATAYDATHGFSDQYIVEVDVFLEVAAEAGLYCDKQIFRKFPDSDLATVTINLLRGKEN